MHITHIKRYCDPLARAKKDFALLGHIIFGINTHTGKYLMNSAELHKRHCVRRTSHTHPIGHLSQRGRCFYHRNALKYTGLCDWAQVKFSIGRISFLLWKKCSCSCIFTCTFHFLYHEASFMEEMLSYVSISVWADLINVIVHGNFLNKPLKLLFMSGQLPAEVIIAVAGLKEVEFH